MKMTPIIRPSKLHKKHVEIMRKFVDIDVLT